MEDLYKKWFKTKTRSGFLSVRPWLAAKKLAIEIGAVDIETSKVNSVTPVYVDMFQFGTYLRAVTSGQGGLIFPKGNQYEEKNLPTPESFVVFGGGNVDGKAVSRVFKSHHWQQGQEYDSSAFVWKCGNFEAQQSDQGAFVPNYQAPISTNQIKVIRAELAEISYRVDALVTSLVSQGLDWLEDDRRTD